MSAGRSGVRPCFAAYFVRKLIAVIFMSYLSSSIIAISHSPNFIRNGNAYTLLTAGHRPAG